MCEFLRYRQHFRLVALLVLNLLAALHALSQPYNPQAHVQPSSGPSGKLVTFSVSGQDPGGYTGFCVDGFFAGPRCGPGDCSTTHRMGYPVGDHVVSVNCMSGPTFTVVPPTEFTISPSCLPPGGVVTLKGHHFTAAGVVSFFWDDTFTDSQKTALTDENGDFEVSFPAPFLGEGMRTVTAMGPVNLTAKFYVGASCPDIGIVIDLNGEMQVLRPDGSRAPLRNGDPIKFGDVLNTKPGANAEVMFSDGTSLSMAENTKVRMDAYIYDPANQQNDSATWRLLQGTFQMISGAIQKRSDNNVSVDTPYGTLGIRGTEFILRGNPCSQTQEVYLIHGQLSITRRDNGATNIVNAPATILFDSSIITTSALTQATYAAIKAELFQTNVVYTAFEGWQLEFFGCTNSPSAQPGADPDSDGQSNLAEFRSGTNPTDAASVFRISRIARENDDLRLTWMTRGGKTNVIEAAADPTGTYSNISGNIVITGNSDTTTNFVVIGGAAVGSSRYYRIRLVQ